HRRGHRRPGHHGGPGPAAGPGRRGPGLADHPGRAGAVPRGGRGPDHALLHPDRDFERTPDMSAPVYSGPIYLGPGELQIGAVGAEIDVSCMVNGARIAASKDEGDDIKALCGTVYPGSTTYTAALSGSINVDADNGA